MFLWLFSTALLTICDYIRYVHCGYIGNDFIIATNSFNLTVCATDPSTETLSVSAVTAANVGIPFPVPAQVHCAWRCTAVAQCDSFNYRPQAQKCDFYNYQPIACVPQQDCQYFETKGNSGVCRGTTCPGSQKYYNGFCYDASSVQKQHSDARNACKSVGGDLTSISDNAELNFILTIVASLTEYWIGLYKKTATRYGETYWLDGNPSNYTNWDKAAGDPNGDTQCIRMVPTGKFRDIICATLLKYICKKTSA